MRQAGVERAVQQAASGRLPDEDLLVHTRYREDGSEGSADWENFQLDGFGTWLWALSEHLRVVGTAATSELARAARSTADYLVALWRYPCYDLWEEFRDEHHTYTLAAIYGGLSRMPDIDGSDYQAVCEEIRDYLEANACCDGQFVKFVGDSRVDASLVGLAVPYRVFDVKDARVGATVERIEADLVREGGVHRYEDDTFYGGGVWILLTAWLGWYYARAGRYDRARSILHWIESQADAEGSLPEQVTDSLNDPSMLPVWEDKWGPSADPLLWSSAMYVVLVSEVGSQ